jgi:hypothetical protein
MNPVHTLLPYILKIHFNIILPCKHTSSEWSLSFRLSIQNCIRIYYLQVRNSCPTHGALLDLIIQIIGNVQIVKLLIMKFLQLPVTSSLFSPVDSGRSF